MRRFEDVTIENSTQIRFWLASTSWAVVNSPFPSDAVRVLLSRLAISMLYGANQALIYTNRVYCTVALGLLFFLRRSACSGTATHKGKYIPNFSPLDPNARSWALSGPTSSSPHRNAGELEMHVDFVIAIPAITSSYPASQLDSSIQGPVGITSAGKSVSSLGADANAPWFAIPTGTSTSSNGRLCPKYIHSKHEKTPEPWGTLRSNCCASTST